MMAAELLKQSIDLRALFEGIADVSTSVTITGMAIDSRQVEPGDMFMAYRGSSLNGMDFIDDAVAAGAIAIAIDAEETMPGLAKKIPVIRVPNLRKQTGLIASRFYGHPSEALNMIGVTGTNGKTTVSFLLSHALSQCHQETAFIGTLGYGKTGEFRSGNMTTPDPIKLQSLFAGWKSDLQNVVMEVSSHALDQDRVAGVAFDIAVFTNLSRDHLDYHETLENYAAAKERLFQVQGLKHAVINYDDEFGRDLVDKHADKQDLILYSTHAETGEQVDQPVVIGTVENNTELDRTIHISSPWGEVSITTRLLGEFNVSNILAAFSVLCLSGVPAESAAAAISSFRGVPGRMESFPLTNKPLLVVDYAHTPDALEKALTSLRPYCRGKLYCVFGCGGDRDNGKRPLMGTIAETHADVVVLTNDNPRTEQPERIVSQILAGMQDKERVIVRYDRSDAIINTYLQANSEDIVLIAGKGHETTQQVGNDVLPFSDRELAWRLTEETA